MNETEFENAFFTSIVSHSSFAEVTDLNPTSPAITARVLNRTTSHKTLIENIERENEGRDIFHRIPYTIYANHLIIEVVHAQFINDDFLQVIARNSNGLVHSNLGKTGERDALLQGLGTYVIAVDHIDAVAVGSYDQSQLNLGDSELIANDENQLVKKLSDEIEVLNTLKSSGQWRSVIKRFNIFCAKENINRVALYEFNRTAYKKYNDLWRVYTEVLQDIITNFMMTPKETIECKYECELMGVNCNGIMPIRYFKTKDDIKEAVQNYEKRLVKHLRERISVENCFLISEVESIETALEATELIDVQKNSGAVRSKIEYF